MRGYVILSLQEEAGLWREVGGVTEARSSDEALRRFFTDPPEAEGTFVAVSRRSWQPRKVASRVRVSIM